jgi:exodeoxyribonuclease V alpha subunit
MMARLLEALRPQTRLILVGDPDQLTSVDAGAVLSDLVARPVPARIDAALIDLVGADLDITGVDGAEAALSDAERSRLGAGIVRLSRGRRFDGAIAQLAAAVRVGDADQALELLHAGGPVSLVAPGSLDGVRADVVRAEACMRVAATAGDIRGALAHLEDHRLLCAHREGAFGVREWDRQASVWVSAPAEGWYPGQPLLVTANDHEAKVYNGDTGVVVRLDGTLVAAFGQGNAPVLLPPTLLASVETAHALTIHRSQGSQYDAVSVVLPHVESRLLSRELLYTAVTRARRSVRLVGTDDAFRAGVQRRVLRASGLQHQVRSVSGQ